MSWQKMASCIAATTLVVLISLSAVMLATSRRETSVNKGGIVLQEDRGVVAERERDDLWNSAPVKCTNGRCRRNSGNQVAKPEESGGGDQDDDDDGSDDGSDGGGDSNDGAELPLSLYGVRVPPPTDVLQGNSSQWSLVYKLEERILLLIRQDAELLRKENKESACKNLQLRRFQMAVCRGTPSAMPAIVRGIQAAVNQTVSELSHRRWDGGSLKHPKVGQNLMKKQSKQSAYSHAVIAAGIAYSVTKSCYNGEIRDCQCDNSLKRNPDDLCSDDVAYGAKMAADFLDDPAPSSSLAYEINHHNNRVGRRAVLHSRENVCVCHGTSGACTVTTCYKSLPKLSKIVHTLADAYDRAFRVYSNELVPPRGTSRLRNGDERAGADDLVYLQRSPNFCSKSPEVGSMGTRGRVCESDHRSVGSCLFLCCGRGSRVRHTMTQRACKCTFRVSTVVCGKCSEKKTFHICR